MGEIRMEDLDLDALNEEGAGGNPPSGGEEDPTKQALDAAKQAADAKPPPPEEVSAEPDKSTEWDTAFDDEELKGKSPTEIRQMFDTYRQISQNAAAYLRQQVPNIQQQQQPAEPEEPIFGEDDDPALMDGRTLEDKVTKLFERKARPFVQQTQSQLLQQAVVNSYQQAQQLPYFDRFRDEIMQMANSANPQDLAHPNSWRLLHDHVVQRHLDDIVRERVEEVRKVQPEAPFTETGQGSGRPDSRAVQESGTAELSAIEKEISEGLGLPEQVFAQMKSIRGGQNG